MFRATTSSPVRPTGGIDTPAVDSNRGEVGGHAVNAATPGTPRATLMPPAPDFSAAAASTNHALQIQSQDPAKLPSAKARDVMSDGSLTETGAKNRGLIARASGNHPSRFDSGYPVYTGENRSSIARGRYPASIKEMEKRIAAASVKQADETNAGQPAALTPAERVLHELAPDWHDKPVYNKHFNGLATFTDDEIISVEGHRASDTHSESMAKVGGAGSEVKSVKVTFVNGKAILPVTGKADTEDARTTAATCHNMLLLDKDRNVFANDCMPRNKEALDEYLAERGAEVTVHHFKNLETLKNAIEAHGPLVVQVHHRVALDWDADDPDDRFKGGQTLRHYIVVDDTCDGWADIRDPARDRSMRVQAETLLLTPEDADLDVESEDYGCYEIIEQRNAPAATTEDRDVDMTPVQPTNDVEPPMTYTQQAAVIKQYEAKIAEQAATIARLEAIIAQQFGHIPNFKA